MKILTMTELTLMCNYKHCKVLLTDFACVTRCFHIFCKNHVIQGENAYRRCHTCSTVLEGDEDFILHENLNPTEDLKSFMLTGYSFKVISDIISRAIHFWDYQTNTKIMEYKVRVENVKAQSADKDCVIERLTLNIKHYIKKQREKVDYLKREVENSTASVKDLEKQLGAKNHQLLNMQSRYEELRRNTMASLITQETNSMDIEKLEEIVSPKQSAAGNKRPPPATPVFEFNPTTHYTSKSSGSSGSYQHSVFQFGSTSF